MSCDLPDILKTTADTLKAYGAREVYVFGSATSGTMRETCDVDRARGHETCCLSRASKLSLN